MYHLNINAHKLEQSIIDEEVRKLIPKKVIVTTYVQEGDFFSNLFIRSKKDGSYRTILNLKKLNQDYESAHFKMESIKQVTHMIKPNMYLASLDIKDAFYTVPIYKPQRMYLKFMWLNKAYQFIVMSIGCVDAKKICQQDIKASPLLAPRTRLAGETYQECCDSIYATMSLFKNLHYSPDKIIICTITRNNLFRFRN